MEDDRKINGPRNMRESNDCRREAKIGEGKTDKGAERESG